MGRTCGRPEGACPPGEKRCQTASVDLQRTGRTSALPQRVLRTLDRVNVPPVVQRHPALRWLAPAAVVGVVGVVATGILRAEATSETLPHTNARSLISAVQRPELTGFSGSVVSKLSLGLPELPSVMSGDDGSSASFASLLTGSHTLKVWYGGPDKQRVALLGETDETDVFRSGRDVWQWSSADRTALHAILPAHPAAGASGRPVAPQPSGVPSALPHGGSLAAVTPSGLAEGLLRDLEPSTRVTVSSKHRVADRSAYELVLTPRSDATTIGSVRIAVDGKTKVPLGVRIFARGKSSPAVDVEYTSISFAAPSSTYFSFTPPAGAEVRTVDLAARAAEIRREHARADAAGRASSEKSPSASAAPSNRAGRLTATGTGWDTVWTLRAGDRMTQAMQGLQRGVLADASRRVVGPWGAGRLVTTDLVNALVIDDGRVLVGAVEPNSLYAAAR